MRKEDDTVKVNFIKGVDYLDVESTQIEPMNVWVRCMYCNLEFRRCGFSSHLKTTHKEVAQARLDMQSGNTRPLKGVDWTIIGTPSVAGRRKWKHKL